MPLEKGFVSNNKKRANILNPSSPIQVNKMERKGRHERVKWQPISHGRAVGPKDSSCTHPLWDRSFINHLYVFIVIAYVPRSSGLLELSQNWINLVKANPQSSSRDLKTSLVATGTNVHVSICWNPSSATCRRLKSTSAVFGDSGTLCKMASSSQHHHILYQNPLTSARELKPGMEMDDRKMTQRNPKKSFGERRVAVE